MSKVAKVLLNVVMLGLATFMFVWLIWAVRHRPPSDKKAREIEDYVDTTISIHPQKVEKALPPDEKRLWKRDYRRYLRLASSPERFPRGYLLAVRGLKLAGLPVVPSDTTCEIDRKALSGLSGEEYHLATLCYNAAVYGGDPSHAAEPEKLDLALAEIARLQKSGWQRETPCVEPGTASLTGAAAARARLLKDGGPDSARIKSKPPLSKRLVSFFPGGLILLLGIGILIAAFILYIVTHLPS